MNDRYIEIYTNADGEFIVNVRWCIDGEQHELWAFDTIQEVNSFLEQFYNK